LSVASLDKMFAENALAYFANEKSKTEKESLLRLLLLSDYLNILSITALTMMGLEVTLGIIMDIIAMLMLNVTFHYRSAECC
jgi:uncharacterized oligopeptide transporter (OPT) family protein